MTKQFTCSCFIRKNTPEIRQRLEEFGWKHLYNGQPVADDTDTLCTRINIGGLTYYVDTYHDSGLMYEIKHSAIDCGTDEELFFALAALNDTDDKDQWFTDSYNWEFCTGVDFMMEDWQHEYPSLYEDYHKATPEELLQHFTNINK